MQSWPDGPQPPSVAPEPPLELPPEPEPDDEEPPLVARAVLVVEPPEPLLEEALEALPAELVVLAPLEALPLDEAEPLELELALEPEPELELELALEPDPATEVVAVWTQRCSTQISPTQHCSELAQTDPAERQVLVPPPLELLPEPPAEVWQASRVATATRGAIRCQRPCNWHLPASRPTAHSMLAQRAGPSGHLHPSVFAK
jgi:hypothetical protein